MKKLSLCGAMGWLFVSLSLFAQGPQTFTGEIMDSQCASLKGHQAMISPGETAKDCTDMCVKSGGKYVLFDAATKTVYRLDDQKKPATFSGAKVNVTGTLDASTKTIHVTGIKTAS
jgi:hypothetical protein